MNPSQPFFLRLALLGLSLVAFAWRSHSLTHQSLWRDEVDAIYFALRELPQTLAMFLQAAQNGPLYFLSLRPWFYLVGATEFALRYPSAWAGTLSVPLLWQVTRLLVSAGAGGAGRGAERLDGEGDLVDALQITNETVAPRHPPPATGIAIPLLATLFLTLNPYLLWYSQEGKMYAIVTMLTLLATWCWLRGISHGGWRPWLAYLVTVSLAIYCHLLMVLIFPLHFLWFLLAWPQSRYHWRGYALALAGLTLPYLPMLWWQWGLLTSSEIKTGFSFTPLDEILRVLFFNYSRGYLPSEDLLRLAPLIFLLFAGALLGSNELANSGPTRVSSTQGLTLSQGRRWLLIVTWLFVPIFSIYALSLRQPVFTDRYIIWIAPAALILLALGVAAVRTNLGKLGWPVALCCVLYVAGFWIYAGWQQKSTTIKYDLRSAITYIATRRQPETLLILQIPHMEWSYRYYSGDFSAQLFQGSDARLGNWIGGLWTNGADSVELSQARALVDAQMQISTTGVSDLWVMYSEVEMWDKRHLMEEWLNTHGQVVDQAEFHGTQAKRYRLTR